MSGTPVYRTAIAPEWIDYNGHLRDAYYSLIVSLAVDALMDRLGLDEAYRTRTRCTLYTLEMHIHFLREVKKTDVVDVSVRILGTDRKRIHAALDMRCERHVDPVATAEVMLLHVHQGVEPKSQAFPPEVVETLAKVAADSAAGTAAAGTAAAGFAEPGSGLAPGSARAGSGLASDTAGARPPNATAAHVTTPAAASTTPGIPGSRRMELRSRS